MTGLEFSRFKEISHLTDKVKVVHAIPGRVRLRAADKDSKAALATIGQALQQLNGWFAVRASDTTGSLLITFDPQRLSLSQLTAALEEYGITVAPKLPSNSPEAESHSEVYAQLADQLLGLLPLLLAVLVTRQFNLRGWRAIPVYLMAAGVSRQL